MRTAVLALVVGFVGVASAGPQAYSPALALFHTDSTDNPSNVVQVSITGDGFGSAQSGTFAVADCGTAAGGSFAVVYSGFTQLFVARSTVSSEVSAWTNKQIVLKLSSANGSQSALSVRVCTSAGKSTSAAIAKWVYEHVDVPASSGTNALPLSMVRDAGGNVWVNEEFHNQVKRMTGAFAWTSFSIPQYTPPGIFAAMFSGSDIRTPISTLGEDVIVDSDGKVWFSEGGATPYGGVNPNHGRIVMYDPSAAVVRTLNIPGDNNGIFGLSWDAPRGKIWFTESRRSIREGFNPEVVAHRARLTSFYPTCIGNYLCPNPPNYSIANWVGNFNFDADAATYTCVGGSTSPPAVGTCQNSGGNNGRKCFTSHDCVLSYLRCSPSNPWDYWCFHEYEIPDTAGAVTTPSHVLAHSDGTVWYSAYWGGNHVGRLDPATGTFQQYPLADPADKATCNYGSCYCFFPNGQQQCPQRCCLYLLLGQGPWSLVEEPSRNISMSFQNQAAVGRFDFARANESACLALDGGGQNPCVTYDFVPTFNPDAQFPHSAQIDGAGNVWLSEAVGPGGPDTDCSALTSVGYRQVSTGRVLMFPPLSFYPKMSGSTCTAFSGNGMAYDPSTQGMWFTDFFRKRLGRIRPQ
jgi:streptogramin lyase